MKIKTLALTLVVFAFCVSCKATTTVDTNKEIQASSLPVSQDTGNVGIANPASVNCVNKGGTLDIRESTAGQYGVCVFDDKSECEEWALFRNECKKGDNKPK